MDLGFAAENRIISSPMIRPTKLVHRCHLGGSTPSFPWSALTWLWLFPVSEVNTLRHYFAVISVIYLEMKELDGGRNVTRQGSLDPTYEW